MTDERAETRRSAARRRTRGRRRGAEVPLRLGLCVVPLLLAVACADASERGTPPPKIEVPSEFEVLNVGRWTGDLGLIDGDLVDLYAVVPPAGVVGAEAALRLCQELADGARVVQRPRRVPADWKSCQFETDDRHVWIGTLEHLRGYSPGRARLACGEATCPAGTLVVWVG